MGKSAISFALAREIPAEIISADSRQFFCGLDIGTDKVPRWMREQVPHHLIDFLQPGEPFDVYEFFQRVLFLVGEILSRKKYPIIVGGSGLYLRCLLQGIFHLPEEKKEHLSQLRRQLESFSTEEMWQKLREVDPVACTKIHPHDRFRLRRALEVYLLTGQPLSYLQRENLRPVLGDLGEVTYFILNRPRAWLYQQLDQRVEKMLQIGWLEEVARLKIAGHENFLREKAPIGYAELLDVLRGKLTVREAVRLIKQKTKQLVRRQLSWFRQEPGCWLEVFPGEEAKVVLLMKNALGEK
ncbi:MAG: tRNA (adenosine(37)-N6)-dimethylallyltransferase MiaA [Candidatus Omnitrophica bacterium]|nr:tRNA (adenosine(37)-N6)-dimethylallyltransferase MiaA [Candidatus Omnitrophota bacterium]